MRYVIVTGEISGDKIGAAVAVAIQAQDPDADIYAMGSQALEHAGAEIIQRSTDLSVMGISSLPKKFIQIRRAYHKVRGEIDQIKPDAIIYVDFAGFNLRLGRWAKSKGYKNIYIAPPKTWASRAWRNQAIRRDFDLLIALFPFANEYFLSQGHHCRFYGHPLLSSLQPARVRDHHHSSILLAPGSRIQEIERIMPVLSAFILQSTQFNFIVSKIPGVSSSLYDTYLKKIAHVTVSEEPLRDLLPRVSMAIITSGTATLEAAIIGIPQVVIYRTSSLNYLFAKQLIKTEFISLPNLLLDQRAVPELIQAELTVENLIDAIKTLVDHKKTLMSDYARIREMYDQHNPSERIASAIIDQLTMKSG